MENHQVDPNKSVNSTPFLYVQQGEVSSEKIPEEMTEKSDLLSMNVQTEFEYLTALIKEVDEELLRKDLRIKRLKQDIMILTDANEELEKEVEKNKAERWECEKRKILLLR